MYRCADVTESPAPIVVRGVQYTPVFPIVSAPPPAYLVADNDLCNGNGDDDVDDDGDDDDGDDDDVDDDDTQ
jgi:hypothetical protein